MARKGLRLDLRTLFREAVETGRTRDARWRFGREREGRVQIVTSHDRTVADEPAGEPLYLVLFADQGPVLSREDALTRIRAAQDGVPPTPSGSCGRRATDCSPRSRNTRPALEELKSSNEELVSVNEEMQSTNEELEASKEELQSVNEELHTVNAELNGKIDALDRANSDLLNLFESTDVATVFLG